ncbi:IS3 family transposase [Streptomyces gelaticus]
MELHYRLDAALAHEHLADAALSAAVEQFPDVVVRRRAAEGPADQILLQAAATANLLVISRRPECRTDCVTPPPNRPDRLDRDFVAQAPNRCWVADFTHIKTWSGVVHAAFVVDTFSRRIVGWSAATVKETVFVLDALEMAIWQRDREQHPIQPGELIHHSDAGSTQYTSFRLAEHLDAAGIAASIGSVGDGCDNALMESAIGLYKTELIKLQRPWKTLSQVELATAEWADWYNHRRLHGEIGHIPPAEHEANYSRELTKPQVTTTI